MWGCRATYQAAFCNGDNDELFRQYVNLLAPAMPTADLTCAAVAPGGGLTTVIYPSSDQYHACAEPAIASFCAETCKTNCWSFPPLRAVDVYLPGCHPTDLDFNPVRIFSATLLLDVVGPVVGVSHREWVCEPMSASAHARGNVYVCTMKQVGFMGCP